MHIFWLPKKTLTHSYYYYTVEKKHYSCLPPSDISAGWVVAAADYDTDAAGSMLKQAGHEKYIIDIAAPASPVLHPRSASMCVHTATLSERKPSRDPSRFFHIASDYYFRYETIFFMETACRWYVSNIQILRRKGSTNETSGAILNSIRFPASLSIFREGEKCCCFPKAFIGKQIWESKAYVRKSKQLASKVR